MGRGASAAARRSRSLGAPATAWEGRASLAVPSADGIHRTAGDVTRLSGGVGFLLPTSPSREQVYLVVTNLLRHGID
jgi:hypothetical protein